MVDHVVGGGGHNGLVTVCYLARAGQSVLVVERSAKLGGGSRTDELIPGYRFNAHSAAHNIINATGIVEELGLRAVGLEYREMDPFSIAVHRDGGIVRFHRSVERTVESIREVAPADADRYRAWIADTMPIITLMSAGLETGAGRGRQWRRLPTRAWAAGQALAHNGGERISSSCVITAIDPQTALLALLDPPLSGVGGDQLTATHRSNAVPSTSRARRRRTGCGVAGTRSRTSSPNK